MCPAFHMLAAFLCNVFGVLLPFHLIVVNKTVKIYWEPAPCGMVSILLQLVLSTGQRFVHHIVALFSDANRVSLNSGYRSESLFW